MSFLGDGWYPGVIAMGTAQKTVLPNVMAFRGSDYGITYDESHAFIYKVLPAPSSPTGYVWQILPTSIVTLDPSTMFVAFSTDSETIVLYETFSSSSHAVRLIKRDGDTISITGSQCTVTSAPSQFNQEYSMVRVGTGIARAYTNVALTATIVEGLAISGSSVSVITQSPITVNGAHYSTPTVWGLNRHYGDGVILGEYQGDLFASDKFWTAIPFTVAGGVSGAPFEQRAFFTNNTYIYIAGIDGVAETVWSTNFSDLGYVPVSFNGSTFDEGHASRTVPFSDPFPIANNMPDDYPNPYVTATGVITGAFTSTIWYSLTEQSGDVLTVTQNPIATAFKIDSAIGEVFDGFDIAVHPGNVVAAVLDLGSVFGGGTLMFLPAAFAF